MVDQQIIEKINKYLTLIPVDLGIKKAYLFGSFSKGLQKEDSDIDIALVLENMPDFFYVQNQLMKLRRNVDLRIEPHPIKLKDFNSSNPFAYEIQQTGIEISIVT
jgi:predicted nucleotidyltransferase